MKLSSVRLPIDKIVLISTLYVSQSIPVSFLKTGFQVFLKEQGIDYTGLTSILGLLLLPWTIKFLWAPIVDRYGNDAIGHRKSWIIPLQLLGSAVLVVCAFLPLESYLLQITLLFLFYSFICATQDMAVDGLAVLSLSKKEHGLGNGMQMGGYYLGELVGGALILVLFNWFGWTVSILALALVFLIPLIPVLRFKEGKREVLADRPKNYLADNKGYLKQESNWWILLLFIYMGNQVLARTLLPSILTEQGWTAADIGFTIGLWGNTASMVGAILGGLLINSLGRKNSLLFFGLLKIPAFLLILFLNQEGVSSWSIRGIIMLNDFIAGLATVALFTVMMDKCRLDFPGTDFSIQQSFNAIGVLFFVILSGFLKKYAGLDNLIYVAVVLGFFSVWIVWRRLVLSDRRDT